MKYGVKLIQTLVWEMGRPEKREMLLVHSLSKERAENLVVKMNAAGRMGTGVAYSVLYSYTNEYELVEHGNSPNCILLEDEERIEP